MYCRLKLDKKKYSPPCFLSVSVLCTVDLTKHKKTSLHLEKIGSDPYCEMSVNSVVEKKINVAAGTKASLSFLDCPNEDVRLTASEVIGKMFADWLEPLYITLLDKHPFFYVLIGLFL